MQCEEAVINLACSDKQRAMDRKDCCPFLVAEDRKGCELDPRPVLRTFCTTLTGVPLSLSTKNNQAMFLIDKCLGEVTWTGVRFS